MKTFIGILASSIILVTACNQNKSQQTTDSNTQADEAVKSCYLATSGKDSVSLSFDQTGEKVTGNLSFNFAEKDDLNGEIKGAFSGDTLFVDYDFKAEGTVSRNPLVFLKQGNNLQQGYGEMVSYLGKTYFKDHSKIKFEDGFLFKPVECK